MSHLEIFTLFVAFLSLMIVSGHEGALICHCLFINMENMLILFWSWNVMPKQHKINNR